MRSVRWHTGRRWVWCRRWQRNFFGRCPVLSRSHAKYRNVPWCNGQLTSFGSWTLRVRFLARAFFSARLFFLPCTHFLGSAWSPGQIFMWMLNHRCADILSVGTLRCTCQFGMYDRFQWERNHAENYYQTCWKRQNLQSSGIQTHFWKR